MLKFGPPDLRPHGSFDYPLYKYKYTYAQQKL